MIYSVDLLRRVASTVRAAAPEIVLTHSPEDYMVDHTETAKLAVSAAFAVGVPNFATDPPHHAVLNHACAVYHAPPHGLADGLRRPFQADLFVDTSLVLAAKREALLAHESQRAWLAATQGIDSYVAAMEQMSRELGRQSGRFEHAEAWRRHSHLGFAPSADFDPLSQALGEDVCAA